MDNKISLNYKASNIAKAETALGQNFFTVISSLGNSLSFGALRFLVIAGGGTDEDFDTLVKAGFDHLMEAILEGINNAGFLGQEKFDTKAIVSQMREGMAKATNPTLPISGAKTNR